MSLRELADQWFIRQPPWRRGALIGAFAYSTLAVAFSLSDVQPWPGLGVFAARALWGLAFGAVCGGAGGGAYGIVLGWFSDDRLRSHMLAGTAAMSVLVLPIAFLARAALGWLWPVYAVAAAAIAGAGCLAPIVRAEQWNAARRNSRRRVA
jgi:MFS family permease